MQFSVSIDGHPACLKGLHGKRRYSCITSVFNTHDCNKYGWPYENFWIIFGNIAAICQMYPNLGDIAIHLLQSGWSSFHFMRLLFVFPLAAIVMMTLIIFTTCKRQLMQSIWRESWVKTLEVLQVASLLRVCRLFYGRLSYGRLSYSRRSTAKCTLTITLLMRLLGEQLPWMRSINETVWVNENDLWEWFSRIIYRLKLIDCSTGDFWRDSFEKATNMFGNRSGCLKENSKDSSEESWKYLF